MNTRPPTHTSRRRVSRRRLLLSLSLPVMLLSLVWNFSPPAASKLTPPAGAAQDQPNGLENYDIRVSRDKAATLKKERHQERARERRHLRAARAEQLRAARESLAGQGVRVEESEQSDAPEVVSIGKGRARMRAARGEARDKVVRRFLSANRDLYGLSSKEVGRLRKRAEYTNPDGGLSWVSLEQSFKNIPVFQGELTAALNSEGELFHTTGKLVADFSEKEVDANPGITAQEAIAHAAASLGLSVDPASLSLKEAGENGFVFSGGPFTNDTKIELVFFPLESGSLPLGWSTYLYNGDAVYYIIVDAEDGQVFFRKNAVNDQTQAATYVVYGSDSPAPLSPSLNLLSASVPVDQGVAVGRDTFTLIHQHPSQNDPWLNDGDNTTIGNNVDAGLDLVSPDGIEAGTRPVGAPFRVFDFAYDPAPGFLLPPGESPTLAGYRNGEVVNMFYWTNRFHDITYGLGFTETARNFQQNNYGRGGAQNDRVLAQGQDFSGTSNANFLTLPDGTPGRMQMYIFNGPTPDRTSGLDQEILIHELTHGLSNRLHGNASGLNFAQGGGMGEGWSDFYARAILSTADEDINGIYGAGGYSTLQITGAGYTQNYYYGIRRFPYALKTTLGANGKPHNPLTFADVDASKINLTDGAFPRGPIGSATAHAVHNVGEVWCMTLLEVRARLIALHGFAVGNQRVLQLVTDGMKLNPADPTILNARDSILAASAASGGTPAEEKAIWEGFATRGMGFGATVSAASSSPITVGESFDIPNLLLGDVAVAADSCDSGGTADPGEDIELAVELTNPLSTPALGATAEIVGGGSASYGDIAGNGSATRNLTYSVPSSAECGEKITLTININSSLGPVTKTYVLQVGTPTSIGPAVTATTGAVAVPIPDLATTDIPVNVTDTGLVGDVNVRIRLNHTFDGDLQLRLVAPDGTEVPLANNRGGSGDNFGTGANDCSGVPTVFDDSAATAISAGVAPFANTFRPETPLAALNGKQMNGIWKVRVVDTANLDVGTFGCATLEIQPQLYYCCGVPGTPIINAAPPAVVVAESASPANNAPDPDETVTMSFPLKNVGTGATTNLVATLLPGGGVHAPSGPQSYGSFTPVDAPVARNYTFVASGNCGSTILATFHLQDGPLDLGTVSFPIQVGSTVVGGAAGANPASIAIPGTGTGASTGAPANPYPSTINISGVTGTVTKVTASITGFSHTFPGDVDILLVGPGGQNVMLMSDVGGGTDAVNASITFDDTFPAIGATVVSGTFRPTNSGTTDPFPAPAPAAPYGSLLSAFNGVSPNGTWSLYVVDDAGTDVGSIAGGWSLTIVTADPFCVSQPCSINMANVTQNNDPGSCGANVSYAPSSIVGSCGVISFAPPSGSFFPVGTSNVLATGTSTDGSTITDTTPFTVTVIDAEGPSITGASVSKSSLWPPNHRMVDVAVNYSVGDNCTAAGSIITSLSVASNEPINGTGDGDTGPDWQIVNANLVRLRAERAGGGTGRIYTITITATDAHGNTTTQNVAVSVPHDE